MASIEADWPAPAKVRAVASTRVGGVSPAPFDALNLGAYTDDDPANVVENRRRLGQELGLPESPRWLRQVHGTRVATATDVERDRCEADAQYTDRPGVVLAVLIADCLPVLLTDAAGEEIAAAHAGWRGLCQGVLEASVAAFRAPPSQLMAWLGPAIGACHYEVDSAVREAFVTADAAAVDAFERGRAGHWWLDLAMLARQRLTRAGVPAVYGGDYCTAGEPARFFSHRRDGVTGRQAALIWRR